MSSSRPANVFSAGPSSGARARSWYTVSIPRSRAACRRAQLDLLAVESDRAAVELDRSGQDLDERALAGAVVADERGRPRRRRPRSRPRAAPRRARSSCRCRALRARRSRARSRVRRLRRCSAGPAGSDRSVCCGHRLPRVEVRTVAVLGQVGAKRSRRSVAVARWASMPSYVGDRLDRLGQQWCRRPLDALVRERLQEAGHREPARVVGAAGGRQHVVGAGHALVGVGDGAPRAEEERAVVAQRGRGSSRRRRRSPRGARGRGRPSVRRRSRGRRPT